MHCPNCGAPLTLVEGRNYFYCGYCTTFHFPTPLDESADGVVPLDERRDMECPVCHRQLTGGAIEGLPASLCTRCRGVLLTNDDFADAIRRRRVKYTGPPAEPVALNRRELQRHLVCPACGNDMEVHPYYGPGNVVIDSCWRCQVVWLDHGEIAAIEHAPGRRR
jgi:Zn-finger nucleic acid-binding protein